MSVTANFRLGQRCETVTNPQAYNATKLTKSVQNITVQPLGVNVKKTFFTK